MRPRPRLVLTVTAGVYRVDFARTLSVVAECAP